MFNTFFGGNPFGGGGGMGGGMGGMPGMAGMPGMGGGGKRHTQQVLHCTHISSYFLNDNDGLNPLKFL